MKLSPITPKQQTILEILYRLRFVNRVQIQQLMHHKDYKRINAWLKDLREKQYVEWIYSTDFTEKTKPAIYHLSNNGIRYLKTLTNNDGTEYRYLPQEVRKRYREASRHKDFIVRCLLVVDFIITLEERSSTATGLKYSFNVKADYSDPNNTFHFLCEFAPDLFYEKCEQTTSGNMITPYLVTVFDSSLPRYMVRKYLKQYVTYLYNSNWRYDFGSSKIIVHIACPTTAELIDQTFSPAPNSATIL